MKFNPLPLAVARWRQLGASERDVRVLARGFALGVGLGVTPLFGLKTLLALVLAPVVRGNRTAAVLGTTLHDIALPFAPALLRLEYDLGYRLLQHRWPRAINLHELHPHAWLSWTTFLTTAPALLIGSLIVALPSALAAYAIARLALRRRAARA